MRRNKEQLHEYQVRSRVVIKKHCLSVHSEHTIYMWTSILLAGADRNLYCITVQKYTAWLHGADLSRHTSHDVLPKNTSRAKNYDM